MLLGSKVSGEIAAARELPPGVDQRSPARHPDWLGPDDMIIKIEELREATDWQVPIFVKMGATRVYDDVKLAAKAGADVVVVDGMEGGTAASPDILQDHTGIPTLAAVCEARQALEDMGLYGQVQLIIAGGIRRAADAAKALALGADAVYIGTAALIALNCNKPRPPGGLRGARHRAVRLPPLSHRPLSGRDHDPGPRAHEAPAHPRGRRAGRELPALAMTLEIQMLARACGKANVHDLEPEDLRALTLESSAITGLPWSARTGCPAGNGRPRPAAHALTPARIRAAPTAAPCPGEPEASLPRERRRSPR